MKLPPSNCYLTKNYLYSELNKMRKKNTSIPVNNMADGFSAGIAIEKLVTSDLLTADGTMLNSLEEGKQLHRHEGHSFFLLERGAILIEIDFQQYKIKAPAAMYVHPNQVHRTKTTRNVVVSALSISNEKLNPAYLALLEDISPAKPLLLKPETFAIISYAVSLCLKFSERKNDKLYHSMLKDSCNALVALVISQYLKQAKPTDKRSRFEMITKAFRETLEQNYSTTKRPAAYAEKLHLSTAYLNECIKNATGQPVSHHIQQRIMLEAKRLLFYSNQSVKEIATALGYEDYPYFSRLFAKVTGMTAISFRNKNRV